MALSAVVPSCSLCCQVLNRARERRVLHSTATASVCTVLGEMATALFPGGVETVFPRKSYLCKQCVRAVERIIITHD